jgi:DNA ligase-1
VRLNRLAQTLARLEEGGSRLNAVQLVATLLKAASSRERAPIVYLLQGQLRPPYEGVEVGLGERLLVRGLARAYGSSEAAVGRRFRRRGDLGLVAEELAGTAGPGRLTVRQAYDALLRIARTAGAGSVDSKTSQLVALLRRAGALEARYLVRIAQGRLRLGVGDATVLEAAAAGALGDRNKRALIEGAYNVRSDLGGVVELAFARGRRSFARIAPRVGIPVRPALAQRLPSADAIIRRMGTVQVEPKYDGFRLQLHRDGNRVRLFSRRLEDVSGMFPELTAGARRQLRARRAIVDGEAVVYDPRTGRFLPFQETISRKRKHGITEAAKGKPLRLFAFDLLSADGQNYLPRPQEERYRRLGALVRGTRRDAVVVTEAITTDRPTRLGTYFELMVRRGLEGIVAKRPDAPYRAGARGFDWVKLKAAYQSHLRDTVDLVLLGYLRGRGKRAALGIGSLLAGVYDPDHDRFRTVAKIGSGLSEKDWKALRRRLDGLAVAARPRRVDATIAPDRWVEPRLVVEVLADEITRSPSHTCGKSDGGAGYALRFPRLVSGIRADKGPAEATTEGEILDMYAMQRARGARAPRPRRPSESRVRAPS